ncbi:hypothetical protein RFI_03379 [Reticulomyxa filosa]|uniref:Viral A-type inclusion protein n=1 Tax=Reticulomyxa filosa TaxID=46433 RepID=X6P6B1_RETFI|nr:hypothetical protein RFI_03379 [Reticulomyxa filosa]|eukprot:ETO33726.1 hypothetical protein RFI_03379 [Reticulomyxa filosa]
MLVLNVERNERKLENEKETFSSFSCYNKDWVLLTNDKQKLNHLICCICNQIANNAMELQCNKHENAGQVYLIGEECLQKYLKQSNGKCPIEQHDHCEFVKNQSLRQQVSNLLVTCPRQYDLKKNQSKDENQNECNYKGKINEMKDHLDNSCRLISIRQIILLVKELQSQLQAEKLQTGELRKLNLKSIAEIEKLNEEIQQLKQCQSAFDIRIIKFEEILKINNDEIKQLKSEKELNEKNQNEEIAKINNENLSLKQQLVLFVFYFHFHINISFMKYIRSKLKHSKKIFTIINYHNSNTENEIQIIIQHWIRILHVKFGWANNFDKLVVNYVKFAFVHFLL